MRRKLSFDDEKDLVLLGKALSSEIRIKILKLLDTKPYCVNEIAELLKIPASSAALNVKVLEEAQLIRTELKPGVRGSMKLCLRQNDELLLLLRKGEKKKKRKSFPCRLEIMWIIKLHPPVELSIQRTILTGRMNQDVFIIHCVRQQSWSGLQRGIWNIVFQMPESRMGGSDDWNYLRNFVQKHRIITWNGHPILPFGLIRGKQERGRVQVILEDAEEN